MNAKLIMLPNPILVSNEQLIKGDKCFDPTTDNGVYSSVLRTDTNSYWNKNKFPKIVAGIEGLPKLDLSAIAEEIGWVDVEKVKSDYFKSVTFGWDVESLERYSYEVQQDAETYARGFIASQSLNEKKWVDNDMIDFHNFIFNHPNQFLKMGEYLKDFKKSRKPKEYNVECIQEGNTIKVTKIINQI